VTIPGWSVALLAAPFVGSFLGVVAARWDRPLVIVLGRSACPLCGAALGVRDLIPVLSWLAGRGRCRHCNGAIALRYPIIEVAALAVAAWAAAAVPPPMLWPAVALGWILLALALTDIENFVLPDFLTLPLLAFGLVESWVYEPDAIAARLVGAAAGGFFVLGLRAAYLRIRGIEGIGLGDAKLLAAAGAWTGWQGLPTVLLLSALLALVIVAWQARGRRNLSLTDRVPYGAYLCFAIWVVWIHGPLGIAD
jgi:leader peptidase (prepilin peptidase)/N-methyltransferase